MKTLSKFFFFFFSFLLSASVFGQECFDFNSCIPQKIRDVCVEDALNGCIDWTDGVIYTVGRGVPNEQFKSQAQRKYSALRAAELVAQRNLLQIVSGVRIDAESTVESGVLTGDRIKSKVAGRLRNVQRVGSPIYEDDGTAAVVVRYFMRDLNNILLRKKLSGKPAVPPVTSASETSTGEAGKTDAANDSAIYSGLILDARAFDVAPALAPKVIDESGREIYGSAYVDRDFVLKHGMMGYSKDLEKAKSNDRIKGNPLVVKPVQSTGNNNANVVISNADGEKITGLYRTQSFLREARVMMILQ